MSSNMDRSGATLKALIDAVSDSALELSVNSQEAYLLASIVLERILKTGAPSMSAVS